MLSNIRTWWIERNWEVQPVPPSPDEEQLSKQLIRQILKVKDFSKVTRLMSPDERKQYAAEGASLKSVYPHKENAMTVFRNPVAVPAIWLSLPI